MRHLITTKIFVILLGALLGLSSLDRLFAGVVFDEVASYLIGGALLYFFQKKENN